MDTETEKIIEEQLKSLPEEIVAFFADPKTNEQILEIGKTAQLNAEQLDIFQMETSLLILGLVYPNDFKDELKSKLNIKEEILNKIIKDIYIFISDEKIEKLKEIYKEDKEQLELDPRFSDLSINIQLAIASSDWQNKLYEIATKNKLTVDKMALLEDITVKVMSGKIPPDKYEGELASALTGLDKDDLKEIVAEVNENIMKVIRAFEQEQTKEPEEDEVPLPPYKKAPVENLSFKNEESIYATSGIQMINETPSKENINEKEKMTMNEDKVLAKQGIGMIEEKPEIEKEHLLPNTETQKSVLEGIENPPSVASSIIGNKLSGPTASMNKVSDYSLPKISKKDDEAGKIPKPPEGYTSKLHDPYHEEVI
ncbi:MAG TPA: hypothetical protein VMR49_02425 [Candidatus Paceibacterota bacterium]|nr:hypothetical protein [Candidatus Paceibacterota bacterium]